MRHHREDTQRIIIQVSLSPALVSVSGRRYLPRNQIFQWGVRQVVEGGKSHNAQEFRPGLDQVWSKSVSTRVVAVHFVSSDSSSLLYVRGPCLVVTTGDLRGQVRAPRRSLSRWPYCQHRLFYSC